jgi:HK97 gp10 family phage protein
VASGMTLTGDVQLRKTFAALKGSEGKAAARKGCRAGAKVVKRRVDQVLPVYAGPARQNVVPGLLHKSAKIKALKRSRKSRVGVRVGVYAAVPSGKSKGAPFGYFQEFGTKRQRGTRIRRKGQAKAYAGLQGQVPAGHFVQKATAAVESQAMQTAQRTMAEDLERRAARLGRAGR